MNPEQFGYSDLNNPFNDSNLGEKFVWKKNKKKDLQEKKKRTNNNKKMILKLFLTKLKKPKKDVSKENWKNKREAMKK